jgi:hypothetical protein
MSMGYTFEPRRRATAWEMEQRAQFLIAKARELSPVTVRGLYYQAEVAGIPGITKSDGDYDKVQQQILKLRRAGRLPYSDISDLTRWMRKPTTFNDVEEMLRSAAATYRKSLWFDSNDYVEIWCEKDALAGTIYPVTSEYDVPLMVTRGFSSETFAYSAIEWHENDARNYYVYYLGDFDRAGQDAASSLCEKLFRFWEENPRIVEDTEINFEVLAVTEKQIQEMGLSTRKPKRNTMADQRWPHDFACELDAIDANTLRDLVRTCIEKHLPPEQLKILKVAEESERELLRMFVDKKFDVDDGGDIDLE